MEHYDAKSALDELRGRCGIAASGAFARHDSAHATQRRVTRWK